MKLTWFTYLLVLGMPLCGLAQVDSTATDSLPQPATSDSLAAATADTLQDDSAEVLYEVTPWDYQTPIGAELAATDSTLRWKLWPGWSYKKNRDPGVISYRLGTIGRTSALQQGAHEPKYQQLYWEDILLNDPVTGTVNWDYIPHHRVKRLYEDGSGIVHQTRFNVRQYYLNEPLTQLNYDESSFDTRSLEFVVSRNFGQKTNAEISYWDRRDGGEYDNSGVVGRQIYARVSHQLDRRQELKINFLNNNFDNSMPFGYVIPGDPSQFAFDRFSTTPNEPSGTAERGSSIIGLNYYRRPADTTLTTSNLHAGIYLNTAKRSVDYSADEVSYKVREYGSSIKKTQQFGPLEAQGKLGYSYFVNNRDSAANLLIDNWGLLRTEGRVTINPISLLKVDGRAEYQSRSDGYSEFTAGADGTVRFGELLNISAGYSMGTRMPTIQQLNWRSEVYYGRVNLNVEKIQSLHGRLEVIPLPGLTAGAHIQLKHIEDGIIMDTNNVFDNTSPYSSLSGTGYFDYNSSHFELSGSATMQQFGDYWEPSSELLSVDDSQRIWLKGSAYIKGYLFDRATFVKAGFAGMFAPQAYRSAKYFPALDYWQSAGGEVIPSFSRLDVDLSARVRTIMILLRYENVLDDVAQQGYFETAGYPMTGRRFIFGIRVLFRN